MTCIKMHILSSFAALLLAPLATFAFGTEARAATVRTLDGDGWRIATDPMNEGREAKWFAAPREKAKPTKVPWIIQDAFPGYHGVAWYWREFDAPTNPHPGGRYLLRFWAADYLAEVWLNGTRVGEHEGGETPFVLDVTDAIRAGANKNNLLAVRVLNPTHERIDGIVLGETPKQARVIPYHAGAAYNHGGITGSVELLTVPPVRVEDLFARADPKTGTIKLMQQEIEDCLRPVISAITTSSRGGQWALEMLRRDATGCVCLRELTELAGTIQSD